MVEQEFNLLSEPWILVMRADGSTEKVSLMEVFTRAAEFRCLAGELPTQDVAVLRLLLSILHTILSRYGPDGEEAQVASSSEAVARWTQVWKEQRFPTDTIKKYLSLYRDRFWLFDPARPFFQVPENSNMSSATRCTADNLNQEISESGNKNTSRFFLQRAGAERTTIGYDEAARWLVCLMVYDTAVKPQGSKCWLASLNATVAEGKNLFETLMLNLVMSDSSSERDFYECPTWERPQAKLTQYCLVPVPRSLAALYTLQTRRVILQRENSRVTGYREICGDFFESENAFIEPMSAWKQSKKKEGCFLPMAPHPERQLWRDLSSLLVRNEADTRPGVVRWQSDLIRRNAVSKKPIRLRAVSAEYDAMGYCIKNISDDSVSFCADLLSEKGNSWISTILTEVSVAETFAGQLAFLAERLAKSAGNARGDSEKAAARERAYFAFDMPFREWLESIDPEHDERTAKQEEWWSIAQHITRSIGLELVNSAGPQALVGRMVKEKRGAREEEVAYSAPRAYNDFLMRTASRKTLLTGGKKNG